MVKLPNAPLQEVIFEVRWELHTDEQTGQHHDAGFDLAAGKFWSLARDSGFSKVIRKIPADIPTQFFNHKIIYQFVPGEKNWPAIQLGPGILTVNDTDENYDWDETYLPLIKKGIDLVNDSFESKREFYFASLRYIDTISANHYGFDGNWQNFLKKHLNFSFQNDFELPGALSNIQFNQKTELQDKSQLQISVSNGVSRKNKEPLLIWQTGIQKNAKFEENALIEWVSESHTTISGLFKKIVKPELYESFRIS